MERLSGQMISGGCWTPGLGHVFLLLARLACARFPRPPGALDVASTSAHRPLRGRLEGSVQPGSWGLPCSCRPDGLTELEGL